MKGHEMLMRLYHTRFTEQIETADAKRSSPDGNDRPITSGSASFERRPDVDQGAVFAVDWVLGWTRNPFNRGNRFLPLPLRFAFVITFCFSLS
jgi:hypothetical protein